MGDNKEPQTQTRESDARKIAGLPFPKNLYCLVNEYEFDAASQLVLTKDIDTGTKCALATLPQSEQDLIRLFLDQRVPVSTIAKDRGVTPNRIHQLLRNAYRHLREPRRFCWLKHGYQGTLQQLKQTQYDLGYQKGYDEGYRTATSDIKHNIERPGYTLSIANLPLESLGLMQRSLNALVRAGYKTVDDIIGLTEQEVLAIRCLGLKSVEDIAQKLQALGIKNTFWNEWK